MILKKLFESKPKEVSDITLTEEEKTFKEDLESLDPKFQNLKNNTIRTFRNIFISDMEPEGEPLAEEFLDWFYLSGKSFLEFVCYNYDRIPTGLGRSSKDELPIYVIRDLVEHEDLFADALTKVAKKWKVIDSQGRDLTDAEKEHTHVLSISELVETMFLDVCSKGLRNPDIDIATETDLDKLSNKSVRDSDLLKDLCKALLKAVGISPVGIVEKFKKKHVCEKCGHSPCICEDVEEVESEQVEIPAEGIEAPVVEEKPEAPENVEQAAFTDMINSAIQTHWDIISAITGTIATFEFNYQGENKEEIITILNQIIDDSTINIGMLHKVSELISTKTTDLLSAGEEKAEQIISEPAKDLE